MKWNRTSTVIGPGLESRKYDDWLFAPRLRNLHMPAWMAKKVGREVPAGSSFINQICIPVVFQVPWGKTNNGRTPEDHHINSNESHIIDSSWGMDRGCGVVASNFSPHQDSSSKGAIGVRMHEDLRIKTRCGTAPWKLANCKVNNYATDILAHKKVVSAVIRKRLYEGTGGRLCIVTEQVLSNWSLMRESRLNLDSSVEWWSRALKTCT
jgi:hypothetical protein